MPPDQHPPTLAAAANAIVAEAALRGGQVLRDAASLASEALCAANRGGAGLTAAPAMSGPHLCLPEPAGPVAGPAVAMAEVISVIADRICAILADVGQTTAEALDPQRAGVAAALLRGAAADAVVQMRGAAAMAESLMRAAVASSDQLLSESGARPPSASVPGVVPREAVRGGSATGPASVADLRLVDLTASGPAALDPDLEVAIETGQLELP